MPLQILNAFPKIRPDLPEAFRSIYESHYQENRAGKTGAASLSSRLERWMHRSVARARPCDSRELRILEIGAGNLNHLPYEPNAESYDIVEPFEKLFRGSPLLGSIQNVYGDINEVPGENRYDKILSVAVLEHLCALPSVVARAATYLKEGGVFCAGIPSEGTVLWKFGWKITTGLEFRRRYGLDYGILMRHEHVNSATEIEQVVGVFFEKVAVRTFGPSRRLSLYQYLEARAPRLSTALEYLDRSRT